MPEDHFGEEIAARCDDPFDEMFQPAAIEPVVDFLAALAGDGPALELGIGTGRIALPLAARGVEVHGVDLSSAMVARLRAKPGGDEIPVAIGDFATARAEGTFSLAYLVFNTIDNLTTQDAQVACFDNVSAQLESGGHFVIEVEVPQLQRLPPGESVRALSLTPTHLGFDEFDVAAQGLISHHYELVEGAWRSHSTPFRYVWPSELDLMEGVGPSGARSSERAVRRTSRRVIESCASAGMDCPGGHGWRRVAHGLWRRSRGRRAAELGDLASTADPSGRARA